MKDYSDKVYGHFPKVKWKEKTLEDAHAQQELRWMKQNDPLAHWRELFEAPFQMPHDITGTS